MKGMRSGDRAWLNGHFVPRESLAIPVGDSGFVFGATVTEQLRTFGGELFLPKIHGERLSESLGVVGIHLEFSIDDVMNAAAEVAHLNYDQIDGGDLGVSIFVTPGNLPAQHEGEASQPRVAVHSFPLAFSLWRNAYVSGVTLQSVSIQQIPEESWPIRVKHRSRLHYYLADHEANRKATGSRAVLCHPDGRVSETSTSNIAIVRDGGVVTPPPTDALSGVSLGFTRRLAMAEGIRWKEQSLSMRDLLKADEIFLTSTPSCILPVTRVDDVLIANGQPGRIFRQLLGAWSTSVGIDIVNQDHSTQR